MVFTNSHLGYAVTAHTAQGITVDSTQDNTDTGETYNYYDHRGRLIHSKITEANDEGDQTGFSRKYFAYNAEDRIIAFYKDGTYEITDQELNQRFDPAQVLKIERFDAMQ